MWEVASALIVKIDNVNQFLRDGYEPFAITTDKVGWERIWLKRHLPDIEITTQQYKDRLDEISVQPSKPKQRRSRKTVTPAEG